MSRRRSPAGAPPSAASTDRFGDPLPPGALARLGTTRSWAGPMRAMAYSPDGRFVATVAPLRPVTLWDAATGRMARQAGSATVPATGEEFGAFALAFDAAGATLAVARPGGRIERLDVASGRELEPLDGHEGTVTAIAYARDGSTLATADTAGTILIRDPRTGRPRLTLKARPEIRPMVELLRVALSADGSRLASTGFHDWALTLWDANSGRPLRAFDADNRLMPFRDSLALAPDGRTLAVGASGSIRIWDADTGRLRLLLDPDDAGPDRPAGAEDREATLFGQIIALDFAPDGRALASASADGTVRLWDPAAAGRPGRRGEIRPGVAVPVATEAARLDYREGHPAGVAFGPDGRSLAAAAADGTIRLWDLPAGAERIRVEGHRSAVVALGFDPTEGSLVSASLDALCVSDPATGATLRREVPLPRVCYAWALAPDGRTLTYRGAADEQRFDVVDTATGRLVRQFDRFVRTTGYPLPHYSADGRTLIVTEHTNEVIEVGEDEQHWITLLDLATGRELVRFKPAEHDYLNKPLLSPGGRILASVMWDTIHLYDAATGRHRHDLILHRVNTWDTGRFEGAAFSPDGTLLATTDGYRAVRLWDVASGLLVRRFPVELAGRGGAIAFAPSGRVVATASGPYEGEPLIQVWDVASGGELARLAGHRAEVAALAFSPDGRRLASGGRDTTVLVWDVAAWA